MKLISMTDFVLEIEKEDYQVVAWKTKITAIDRIFSYANFLKQPLKLEMFVPCDEDGNVLEEPKYYKFYTGFNFIEESFFNNFFDDKDESDFILWNISCARYQQEKEKVLFKGCSVCKSEMSENVYKIRNKNFDLVSGVTYKELVLSLENFTIEKLVFYDIDLSENIKF